MKNTIKILGLIAIIMVSSLLIFATKSTAESKENKENKAIINDTNTSETYQIRALKIPTNLNFAGERVPIEKAEDYIFGKFKKQPFNLRLINLALNN